MRKSILTAAAWLLTGALAAAAAPAPLHAAAAIDAKAEAKQIDDAWRFIEAHQPDKAVALLDTLIAAEDKAHAGERRQVYCAGSTTETLAYTTMGVRDHKSVVVFGPEWSMAIFLKGFALVDLGRGDEAKVQFDRALALSPLNAQFLGELGEWHKGKRDWAKAYDLFKRATDASALMPDAESQKFHKRRGMRGMGFVLIERGKLDEAEALFRQCLEIDPNDAGAKSELQYIQEQRAKATPRTT
ncbi:MAG TPA: tetratricopeptide repeat protein [Allosphingosinicella sp.]|jgi:tetratricopeptide (TPR) repeat protein